MTNFFLVCDSFLNLQNYCEPSHVTELPCFSRSWKTWKYGKILNGVFQACRSHGKFYSKKENIYISVATWSHRIPCNDRGPLTPNLCGITESPKIPWWTHRSDANVSHWQASAVVHARIHWCVDHVKKSDSDAVIFVYKCILSLEHLTHPYPKTYPPLNNIKHVTGKDKCSHRYLLQKLTINKQYKSIANKSCCIPSLLKPYKIFMRRRE